MSNLQDYHFRTLDWMDKGGSATEWSVSLQELVDAGYVVGEWTGSLEYAPYPRWSVTQAGSKAVVEWKRKQLIASTTQCDPGQCKCGYACEVYKVTPCIKCGRNIIKP